MVYNCIESYKQEYKTIYNKYKHKLEDLNKKELYLSIDDYIKIYEYISALNCIFNNHINFIINKDINWIRSDGSLLTIKYNKTEE